MMNWDNPLFLLPALAGILYVVLGIIMLKFRPKRINYLYGYRTSGAMQSQERWDFAQGYAAKAFIRWGAVLTLLSAIGVWIELTELIGVIVALAEVITFTVVLCIQVRRALKQKFS